MKTSGSCYFRASFFACLTARRFCVFGGLFLGIFGLTPCLFDDIRMCLLGTYRILRNAPNSSGT